MGEQISDQEMLFASSELDHNESVVDNEIDDCDLLLVKSQPELIVNPTKFKDDLLYHDEAVQTDLTADQVRKMEQTHFKLYEQRNELKRELFMEDVQRDDNSVKFYTGLPSISCLLMLFKFPEASCKWHEVLGWKEQDTNGEISGINNIINSFLCCEYSFSLIQ